VAKYGEQILMAPPPEGFNLAGYLVPGAAVLVAGALLAAVLLRRSRAAAVPAPAHAVQLSGREPSAADQEKLRRALEDVEA
jgi:cytochrome c-type biogenesis protein CcmH/NrfF